jgi:hypothetical protein
MNADDRDAYMLARELQHESGEAREHLDAIADRLQSLEVRIVKLEARIEIERDRARTHYAIIALVITVATWLLDQLVDIFRLHGGGSQR